MEEHHDGEDEEDAENHKPVKVGKRVTEGVAPSQSANKKVKS